MGKIKHIGHMLKEKVALACFVLVAIALALTGCEQPDNTVKDYIITDDGTWEIYTADGLLAWNKYVTDEENYVLITESGYSYYMVKTSATLMADISLEGMNWTPVGDWNKYSYAGTFDGNDHTISNLKIDMEDTDYVGLFGYVGKNGSVKNLTLSDVNISGNDYVGGIAGYNNGTIENCNVSGTVKGSESYVGGIVGYNYGTIENCNVSGSITGGCYSAGGIAGGNEEGQIIACHNAGTVSFGEKVGSSADSSGGIVGMNSGCVIACYNTGNVEGSLHYVGGIAGQNYGTITACYWSVPEGSTTDYDGIGQGSGSATKVGENGDTWDNAKSAMNEALSESGYNYIYQDNSDQDMPLIIKSSN